MGIKGSAARRREANVAATLDLAGRAVTAGAAEAGAEEILPARVAVADAAAEAGAAAGLGWAASGAETPIRSIST